MSYWNYRVVHRVHSGSGTSLGIYEAFYDAKNRIWGVSENACSVNLDGYESDSEGLKALREELDWFKYALSRPILEYDQIPEAGAKNPADDPDDTPVKHQRSKKGHKA